MTHIYQLEIAAPAVAVRDIARVLPSVASATGVAEAVDPAQLLDATVTLPSGLWVDVAETDEEDLAEPDHFVTDLGLHRTASVSFQVDGTRDPGPQTFDMLSLVFGLLDRVPGDAVLHYDDSQVWLVRRDGRLILHDSDGIWHPDYLATVPPPYERASLAFSDVTPSDTSG